MKKPNAKPLAILFILIAIALAIVGLITGDYLWHIRAGIFLIAAVVVWWIWGMKK